MLRDSLRVFSQHFSWILLCFLLLSCAATPKEYGEINSQEMTGKDMVQSDMNRLVTFSVAQSLKDIQLIQKILYDLNPAEANKSGTNRDNISATIWNDVLERKPTTNSGETRGLDAVKLAMNPSFKGDRVAAYTYGMLDILLTAHSDRIEFYLIHGQDAQKLYNGAREFEIAATKLHVEGRNFFKLPDQNRDARMERAFGGMIERLDVLALVTAEKYRRIGINYVQGLLGGELLQFVPMP